VKRNFQFDESIDDKNLAAKCTAGGECVVLRYPPHRKGQKDREMLPKLLEPSFPLVTLDRRIVDDNVESITNNNGGIIVVKLERPVKTITISIADKIIKGFKHRFKSWSNTDWSRIYLELTETDIYISPLTENPDITKGTPLRYDDPKFVEKVHDVLQRRGLSQALPTDAK
jgi:hypothetical protein